MNLYAEASSFTEPRVRLWPPNQEESVMTSQAPTAREARTRAGRVRSVQPQSSSPASSLWAAAGLDADAAPRRGRVLPQGAAYALAAALIGLCLFASVVPSPLYDTYATLWHFSALTLTLIHATYAFGVLAALLLAGRLSDQAGRRPVLLAGLPALMVSSVLFIAASSAPWLFVA